MKSKTNVIQSIRRDAGASGSDFLSSLAWGAESVPQKFDQGHLVRGRLPPAGHLRVQRRLEAESCLVSLLLQVVPLLHDGDVDFRGGRFAELGEEGQDLGVDLPGLKKKN